MHESMPEKERKEKKGNAHNGEDVSHRWMLYLPTQISYVTMNQLYEIPLRALMYQYHVFNTIFLPLQSIMIIFFYSVRKSHCSVL